MVIKREYIGICSVITGSNKVFQYYSKVIVENLGKKRSIELIIDFGSVTNSNFSIVADFLTIPKWNRVLWPQA